MNKLDALAALRGRFPILEPGHVWLAGAGPGDPGLLTLDALAGLAQADVDRPRRAWSISACWRSPVRRRRSNMPASAAASRRCSRTTSPRRLIGLARERHKVLRLKGGDPCMFGRGGEEALALAEPAFPIASPRRDRGLARLPPPASPPPCAASIKAIIFATGHAAGDFDWAALARTGQPIVIYMAMRKSSRSPRRSLRGGLAAADARRRDRGRDHAGAAHRQSPRLDRLADDVRNIGFSRPA